MRGIFEQVLAWVREDPEIDRSAPDVDDITASIYHAAVQVGCVDAMFHVALCYENGQHGYPKNEEKAKKWHRKAVKKGKDMGSRINLALMCLKRTETEREGLAHLDHICTHGNDSRRLKAAWTAAKHLARRGKAGDKQARKEAHTWFIRWWGLKNNASHISPKLSWAQLLSELKL